MLTPTRRGARALVEAFLKVGAGRALLLPQVRALGDLDEGEPPFEPGEIALDLPPAISPWRRRFELARLVSGAADRLKRSSTPRARWSWRTPWPASSTASRSRRPRRWPPSTAWVELEMASHWEISADFLRLAVEAWPARLKELGLTDVTARRVALLRALAERWRDSPPPGVLVAAGSTGTAPGRRRPAHRHRRGPPRRRRAAGPGPGPGRGRLAQGRGTASTRGDEAAAGPGGVERGDVAAWSPPAAGDGDGRWRRRIINEALRPAEATDDWLGQIASAEG